MQTQIKQFRTVNTFMDCSTIGSQTSMEFHPIGSHFCGFQSNWKSILKWISIQLVVYFSQIGAVKTYKDFSPIGSPTLLPYMYIKQLLQFFCNLNMQI